MEKGEKETEVEDVTNTNEGTDEKSAAVLVSKTDPETRGVLFARYFGEIKEHMALSYYDPEKFERYVNFKIRNPDMKFTTVITRVNIGQDYPFYTNIQEIRNPGSTGVLVNKYNGLPKSFAPPNLERVSSEYAKGDKYLRGDARGQFERICRDAEELGLNIFSVSACRSYSTQKTTYENYKAKNGEKSADTYSARPGHSEHQTGLAVDVIAASARAGVHKTKEYRWYKDNAHHYGFIIRYPSGKSHITGYIFEPWHLRYLGVDLATAVYKSGLTYDEYWARTRK